MRGTCTPAWDKLNEALGGPQSHRGRLPNTHPSTAPSPGCDKKAEVTGLCESQEPLCWTGPGLHQLTTLGKATASPHWQSQSGLGLRGAGSPDVRCILQPALLARPGTLGSGFNKRPWESPVYLSINGAPGGELCCVVWSDESVFGSRLRATRTALRTQAVLTRIELPAAGTASHGLLPPLPSADTEAKAQRAGVPCPVSRSRQRRPRNLHSPDSKPLCGPASSVLWI